MLLALSSAIEIARCWSFLPKFFKYCLTLISQLGKLDLYSSKHTVISHENISYFNILFTLIFILHVLLKYDRNVKNNVKKIFLHFFSVFTFFFWCHNCQNITVCIFIFLWCLLKSVYSTFISTLLSLYSIISNICFLIKNQQITTNMVGRCCFK